MFVWFVTEGVGLVPLLGIDVWEHAYYLQYKNVRADYVKVKLLFYISIFTSVCLSVCVCMYICMIFDALFHLTKHNTHMYVYWPHFADHLVCRQLGQRERTLRRCHSLDSATRIINALLRNLAQPLQVLSGTAVHQLSHKDCDIHTLP